MMQHLAQTRIAALFLLFMAAVMVLLTVAPAQAYDYTRPPTASNYEKRKAAGEGAVDWSQSGSYEFYGEENRKGQSNKAFENVCGQVEGFTARLVTCITGVISIAVAKVFGDFSEAVNAYALALVTLAVVLFGTKLLLGVVEKPGPDAVKLLLLIGGVLFFSNMLGGLLLPLGGPNVLYGIMESLAGYGMSYISQAPEGSGGLAGACGEALAVDESSGIWQRVDCVVRGLFFGPAGEGVRTSTLMVLAGAVFWSGVFGFFIFLAMIACFLMLLLIVIRCVYAYLTAYAFLAILIVIAPLIIPLVLFEHTRPYFDKWLRLVMGILIWPMLLFAYMTFFFALMDKMFFHTDVPYSLPSILGANWQEHHMSQGLDTSPTLPGNQDGGIQTPDSLSDWDAFKTLKETYLLDENDPRFQQYQRYLELSRRHTRIGDDVLLMKRPLIDLEVRPGDWLSKAVGLDIIESEEGSDESNRVAGDGDKMRETIFNWINDKLGFKIIPFEVTVIQPVENGRYPSTGHILSELMRFFVVLLVMLPLLYKSTSVLQEALRRITQVRPLRGMQGLPGEARIKGTISATKGAITEGAKGAAKGFVTGGKAGAIKGAMKGAAAGANKGYKRGAAGGAGVGGGASGGGSTAGRKVIHGQTGNMAMRMGRDRIENKLVGKAMAKRGGIGAKPPATRPIDVAGRGPVKALRPDEV